MVLFRKLESFESTRPAVVCMNDFFKLALARQAHELEHASTPTPSSSTVPPPTASAPVGDGTAGGAAVAGGGGGGAHSRRSIRA